MIIEQFGQFRVALGLTWPNKVTDAPLESIVEAFAARNSVETSEVRYIRVVGRSGSVVGLGVGDSDANGAVALCAAAAKNGDGIYAAVIGSTQDAWVCMVTDGLVIREEIVKRGMVRATVEMANGLPGRVRKVYAGIGTGIDGDEKFVVQDLLERADIKSISMEKLKVAPGGRRRILVALSVATIAALGFVAWSKHHRKPDEAQLRQQAISAFVSGAQSTIGSLPTSSQWAGNALRAAQAGLPAFLGGMSLGEIQCVPSACKAAYLRGHGAAAYSIPAFKAAFGSRATVMKSGNAVSVMVALPLSHKPRFLEVSMSTLMDPPLPAAQESLDSWIGMLDLDLPGSKVNGMPKTVHLGGGVAYGFPALRYQSLSIGGDSYLDSARLGDVLAYLGRGGLSVTQVNWSPGLVGRSGWRITAARLSR